MADLFLLLLLVAIVGLIWGLIAPQQLARHSKKKQLTRKHFGTGFGILAIIFFVLIGITAPKQPTQPQTVQLTTTKSTTTKPSTQSPAVTQKSVTQTKAVPFTSTTVNSVSLSKGETKITTPGVNGVETFTYQDTYTNGKQTSQKLISDIVTTQSIAQVTSVGNICSPYSNSTNRLYKWYIR